MINELAETISLSLNVEVFDQKNTVSPAGMKSSAFAAAVPQGNNNLDINYVSETLVVGTAVLDDINGKPLLSLGVELPRNFYQRGQSAIHYMLAAILVMATLEKIKEKEAKPSFSALMIDDEKPACVQYYA